ncbi:MAG: hypothetical protein KGJ89_00285 [Patescibacteria group bacterium]|nr:hypothetical protein [Patescibacteria group bacterium]MDE2014958.1 hypothetical protein [Patescibacteria group bacterium]MDE2226387.1 hypothetical protein [Patescibacteria group bacterium]
MNKNKKKEIVAVDPKPISPEQAKKEKQEVLQAYKKLEPHLQRARRLRNRQASRLLKRNKNWTRGILDKLEDQGFLVKVRDRANDCHWYFSNQAGFYKSDELYKLLPEKEKNRILGQLSDHPISLLMIANALYGSEKQGVEFLTTLFAYYLALGLIRANKKGNEYSLTPRGVELGVDAQSIMTLETTALENKIFVKGEESGDMPASLAEVREILKKDRVNKMVPVTDLSEELKGKDLKLLFVGEVLYGSQYTDEELLEWILSATDKPSLVITSGLVQGRFEVKNKAKSNMLVEEGGLHKIESQFHSAGLLLDWMEKIVTNKVCVIQGDDDWRLAEDYATLMHLAEGKNPWKFGVNWQSFSAEMTRRLDNKELRRKIRAQWEIIDTYQLRIGSSLLNRQEVYNKIGIRKSEYRLIIEIRLAKQYGFNYPKDYEKVVNVAALYGNIGKRIVTPDTLRLKVADNKEIRVVHNAGFSDITQYQATIQHMDAIARHLGLSRQELPWMLADFHQESFFAEYLMGTWILNLPGMQNTMPAAAYTMKEWNTRILESKERRQDRVRKEPVSPSAPEIILCADGRLRFRILNRSVMKVIEAHKGMKEQRSVGLLATDEQFGSITQWPELVVKFLDYGLHERQAEHLWINGDFIHGNMYPQNTAENRPTRLTSMHAQKKFSFGLVAPLILGAPNLKDVAAWLGNHEWNNFDAKRSGDSPLTFLETGLQGVLMERERLGIDNPLKKALTISRIRWMDTHNPQGDIVNWPFFVDTICGFKVAIQHMWQPFAGRTPADEGKKWLRNMARASRGIDLLLGGDKHSVWMTELGDKVIVQAGAAAGQSGYELRAGLMSTVMFTLIEFSTHHGITVEFVPWEFLLNYKFQSPAYKGKDDEFVRPAEGTKGYQQGKMAPFIENMIDELTGYIPV